MPRSGIRYFKYMITAVWTILFRVGVTPYLNSLFPGAQGGREIVYFLGPPGDPGPRTHYMNIIMGTPGPWARGPNYSIIIFI